MNAGLKFPRVAVRNLSQVIFTQSLGQKRYQCNPNWQNFSGLGLFVASTEVKYHMISFSNEQMFHLSFSYTEICSTWHIKYISGSVSQLLQTGV